MSTCFVRSDRRATKGRILHHSSESKGGRKKRELSHGEGGNDFSVSTIDQWQLINGSHGQASDTLGSLEDGILMRETGQQLVNSKLSE